MISIFLFTSPSCLLLLLYTYKFVTSSIPLSLDAEGKEIRVQPIQKNKKLMYPEPGIYSSKVQVYVSTNINGVVHVLLPSASQCKKG